jgi:hypothetical protein
MSTERAIYSFDLGFILSDSIEKLLKEGAALKQRSQTALFNFKYAGFFSGLWKNLIAWMFRYHLKLKRL